MRAPCKIDGCDKESRGRGWCSTHWLRWRKHGDPNIVLKPGIDFRVKPDCQVAGCDRKVHANGYCHKHNTRYKRTGDPLGVRQIGRPLNGDEPTWDAVHKRLARTRGPAKSFDCVDCGNPAQEWSYDRQDPQEIFAEVRRGWLAYSLNLDHYQPRCVPCHRRFDLCREDIPGATDRLDRPGAIIRIEALNADQA